MSMYVLVAIFFGIISGLLARVKGRSTLFWFTAGLLIGPFGMIVVVMPPKPREGRFIQCPACCEVIAAQATLCKHCGTQLD